MVDYSSTSSANNGYTPLPSHRLDVLDEANLLNLPVNQSLLICTFSNLKTVSSRKQCCDKAVCSELVNWDGQCDGDDSNEGWNK